MNLTGSQTWTNNSASLLTVSGNVSGANLLTVGGTGNTTISGVLGGGSGGLTKNGAGTLSLIRRAHLLRGSHERSTRASLEGSTFNLHGQHHQQRHARVSISSTGGGLLGRHLGTGGVTKTGDNFVRFNSAANT